MIKGSSIFHRLKNIDAFEESRPSLYRWFLRHHSEFEAVLARINRPSWEVIVRELKEEGFVAKNGRTLTTAYARNAWWRADQVHKKNSLTQPASATSTPPPKPAPPTPSQSPPVFIEEPDEDDIPLTFARPASHKKDKPDV